MRKSEVEFLQRFLYAKIFNGIKPMNQQKFDIIVIGAGPGGYPAAIKAAQLGKTVALIEAKELGGTCLNRGCIPSKALIAGSEAYQRVKEAENIGILSGKIEFNYNKLAQHKDAVVSKIQKSLEGLISANKIKVYKGYGSFISPKQVKVTGTDNVILEAEKIIIASGSEPRNIPTFPFDYKKIHDSTSLLAMTTLPKKIVIIGGGIIGCEFASLFSNLDVDVTILELLPRLIPMEDSTMSAALMKFFQKKGIKIHTNVKVSKIDTTASGVNVKLEGNEDFAADIALVSVGRSLNTNTIGLDKAGIAVNDNGIITVDEKMETAVPGIYAVGDIASKWWLAHVATHQGIIAATNAAGGTAKMDYRAIPSVIFTHPEIATVGLTVETAKAQGYSQAEIASFPFQALGKSQAAFQTEGHAQIVLDKRTGQILGAQVIGHEASTLIAEMTVAIANELTLECIAETIHAHPTISEAWMEAALIGLNKPIHWPPKKSIK